LALAALVLFSIISLPTFEPRFFGFIRRALGADPYSFIHEFIFPTLLFVGIVLLLPEARKVRTLSRNWSRVRYISFWIMGTGIVLFGISGMYILLEKQLDIRLLSDAARPVFVALMSLGVSLFYIGFPAFFIRTVMEARRERRG
jgi:uncharacterized protein with PQ loop repeat